MIACRIDYEASITLNTSQTIFLTMYFNSDLVSCILHISHLGTTYALVTTFSNCGLSFGSILGNFIVAPFNVSGSERFDRDSEEDRNIVAIQYAIIFMCNLASLLFLPLLPKGKKETQALKGRAGNSKPLAILALILGLFLFWFTLLYSFVLSKYLNF